MRVCRTVTPLGVRMSLLGAAASLMLACASEPKVEGDALALRGKYMVGILGCDDCHSPKVFTEKGPHPDLTRRLSGHVAGSAVPPVPRDALGPDGWGALASNDMTVWAGPWGISFASNLTPHPDGLGLWTEEQFIKTLRTGLHLGVGRPVLPPMPWPAYSQLPDDDLRAVFAFLKTLPPIANTVPPPMPPPLAQADTSKP